MRSSFDPGRGRGGDLGASTGSDAGSDAMIPSGAMIMLSGRWNELVTVAVVVIVVISRLGTRQEGRGGGVKIALNTVVQRRVDSDGVSF